MYGGPGQYHDLQRRFFSASAYALNSPHSLMAGAILSVRPDQRVRLGWLLRRRRLGRGLSLRHDEGRHPGRAVAVLLMRPGLHRLVQAERHAQELGKAAALGPQARDQLQTRHDVVAHRHRYLDRDAALLALTNV